MPFLPVAMAGKGCNVITENRLHTFMQMVFECSESRGPREYFAVAEGGPYGYCGRAD